MKTLLISLIIACFLTPLTSCSLIKRTDPLDWKQAATSIRSTVKTVTSLILFSQKVAPFIDQVCLTVADIADVVENFDDPDPTFEKIYKLVMAEVNSIENRQIQTIVAVIADSALNTAFDYAEKHYKELMEQDSSKILLIIAEAVTGGLNDACDMVHKYNE